MESNPIPQILQSNDNMDQILVQLSFLTFDQVPHKTIQLLLFQASEFHKNYILQVYLATIKSKYSLISFQHQIIN